MAKLLESILPAVGVGDVKLLRQLLAHLFRGRQQVVQVTVPFQRRDALGGQQEHELFELALNEVGDGDLVNKALEITLREDNEVRVLRYALPPERDSAAPISFDHF